MKQGCILFFLLLVVSLQSKINIGFSEFRNTTQKNGVRDWHGVAISDLLLQKFKLANEIDAISAQTIEATLKDKNLDIAKHSSKITSSLNLDYLIGGKFSTKGDKLFLEINIYDAKTKQTKTRTIQGFSPNYAPIINYFVKQIITSSQGKITNAMLKKSSNNIKDIPAEALEEYYQGLSLLLDGKLQESLGYIEKGVILSPKTNFMQETFNNTLDQFYGKNIFSIKMLLKEKNTMTKTRFIYALTRIALLNYQIKYKDFELEKLSSNDLSAYSLKLNLKFEPDSKTHHQVLSEIRNYIKETSNNDDVYDPTTNKKTNNLISQNVNNRNLIINFIDVNNKIIHTAKQSLASLSENGDTALETIHDLFKKSKTNKSLTILSIDRKVISNIDHLEIHIY